MSKFDPKIQNWYLGQFEYAEFNGDVHFFCFGPEILFLGKFDPNDQNCQFEFKFGTYTNMNMQNTMVVFTFSIFDRKYLFGGTFGLNNQNYQFELKFGTYNHFHNIL